MAAEKEVKSFFDIGNILLKKLQIPSDEEIQKHCVQWMLNSWLSCSQALAPLAAELSRYKLTNREYFDILYYGVPKTNVFIKYSAQKQKLDITIKNVCRHYGCSPERAKSYIKLIAEDELEKINDLYAEKGFKKEPLKGKKK